MTPTYDQLLADIKKNGVNFSDYDLAYAQENPAAGYGILKAKIDYANAVTPEAQALANAEAERWRMKGNYTGGIYGSEYNPISADTTGNSMLDAKTSQLMDQSAYSFNGAAPTWDGSKYQNAPTWDNSKYQNAPTWDGSKYTEAPSFDSNKYTAPTFNDSYKEQYDKALNELNNYAPFSYDASNDPLYAQYRKQYTREGNRAMEDTLGAAAANTGGIASSYAVSAANQARNYYASQLADKIPELYQMAYNQYADEYSRKNNSIGQLMNARNFDLSKYNTELNQFNTDRNFDYNDYLTQLNQYNTDRNFDYNDYLTQLGQFNTNRNFDYNDYLTTLNQYNTDKNFDYNDYLTALSQYNTDRNFDYQNYRDDQTSLLNQINVLAEQDATNFARAQAALKEATKGGGDVTPGSVENTYLEPNEQRIYDYYANLSATKGADAAASYLDQALRQGTISQGTYNKIKWQAGTMFTQPEETVAYDITGNGYTSTSPMTASEAIRAATAAGNTYYEQMQELISLHQRGRITDEIFQNLQSAILNPSK